MACCTVKYDVLHWLKVQSRWQRHDSRTVPELIADCAFQLSGARATAAALCAEWESNCSGPSLPDEAGTVKVRLSMGGSADC